MIVEKKTKQSEHTTINRTQSGGECLCLLDPGAGRDVQTPLNNPYGSFFCLPILPRQVVLSPLFPSGWCAWLLSLGPSFLPPWSVFRSRLIHALTHSLTHLSFPPTILEQKQKGGGGGGGLIEDRDRGKERAKSGEHRIRMHASNQACLTVCNIIKKQMILKDCRRGSNEATHDPRTEVKGRPTYSHGLRHSP